MQLPSDAVLGRLVRDFARLSSSLAGELPDAPLVLPNGDFFPDRFTKDEAGLGRVLKRLQLHSKTADLPIEVRLLGERGRAGCGAGCGSDPSSSLEPSGSLRISHVESGWRLDFPAALLNDPIGMTATLACSLSYMFLSETLPEDGYPEGLSQVTVELGAVALGFGVLLLEASYIYVKSCGGPRVAQLTKLDVGHLAAACAMFIARQEPRGQAWRKTQRSLSATQRALFAEAMEWAKRSPHLFRELKTRPESLLERPVTFGPPLSPWQRLRRAFTPSGRRDEALESALAGDQRALEYGRALAQPTTSPTRKESADTELRALVAEAFPER